MNLNVSDTEYLQNPCTHTRPLFHKIHDQSIVQINTVIQVYSFLHLQVTSKKVNGITNYKMIYMLKNKFWKWENKL